MNQCPPDMMGKGPRQGAPAPSGVAGGVCSWSAVSMEPAVRDKIRKLLGQLSSLRGPLLAPRGGTS